MHQNLLHSLALCHSEPPHPLYGVAVTVVVAPVVVVAAVVVAAAVVLDSATRWQMYGRVESEVPHSPDAQAPLVASLEALIVMHLWPFSAIAPCENEM